MPLLFYCHGKHGTAWDSALYETRWIKKASKRNFFVVYGQASGRLFGKTLKIPGGVALGYTFWGSVYPKDDLRYVELVVRDVLERYPGMIDQNRLANWQHISINVTVLTRIIFHRIYFMGFSSGTRDHYVRFHST